MKLSPSLDLAEAINARRIPAHQALERLRSAAPAPSYDDRHVWEDQLTAVTPLLEDGPFFELLEALASGWEGRTTDAPADWPAFADLVLAGGLIAVRAGIDRGQPVVRRVLEVLRPCITSYTLDSREWSDLYKRCREVFGTIVDLDAARIALDFVLWCARVPDLYYPIDDVRIYAKRGCTDIVACAGRAHREALEPALIRELLYPSEHSVGPRPDLLGLMARIGGRPSLEAIGSFVSSSEVERSWWSYHRPVFWYAFRLIERHDFAPDFIRMLNAVMERQLWRARLMQVYHDELREYAQEWEHEHGAKLYESLDRGGVQFWDYWLTYARERA